LSFCFCRRSCREVRRSRSHRKSRSHFIGHRQADITRDRRTNRPLSDVHPPPTIGLAVRTSSPASYPSKRAHGIVPPHRHHQGCVSSPPSRLSSTKAFAKVRRGERARKNTERLLTLACLPGRSSSRSCSSKSKGSMYLRRRSREIPVRTGRTRS
jgi:hypothetical protein